MTEQEIYMKDVEAAQEGVPFPKMTSDDIEINLMDVFAQLVLRKWLIAKVVGSALLIGLLLAYVLPVEYTGTVRIMTPQQVPSSVSMLMNQLTTSGSSSLAALAVGGGVLKSPNDLYLGLLKTRPVEDAIIKKYDLNQVYHSKDMTAARKSLMDHTEIISEKEGLISISFTDKDKQRVAGVANSFPGELGNLMKTLAVHEASQRREFYEDQLRDAKEALVIAEILLQQVEQKKGIVQPDAQARSVIEGFALIRSQIAAKEVEVQALRSYLTEDNPNLQLAERQLSSLQGEASKFEVKGHANGFGAMGLADVPEAGLEYLRADHEVKYRQALLDLLLKQYDAAKLDEAKEAAIIQIVEPAIEPDRRTSPKRNLIMLLSGLIGFFVGGFLALFQGWLSKERSNPEHIARIQKLRTLFLSRGAI